MKPIDGHQSPHRRQPLYPSIRRIFAPFLPLLIFIFLGAALPAETDTPEKVITEKIHSGEARYSLTDPGEVEAWLGAPRARSQSRDGGMEWLQYEYPGVVMRFARMWRWSKIFTLRVLQINGNSVDIGGHEKIRLRNDNDLQKMDKFSGLENVSLASVDLRKDRDILLNMPFDSDTEWPADSLLPAGFDPALLLKAARNPGLGISALHEQGMDGRGVGIAVIDQPLLLGHTEYTSRIIRYDASGLGNMPPQMHGSPIVSIAVGETIGVAPAAELTYFAIPMWKRDARLFAEALDRIIGLNARLPQGEKIRTVSISTGEFSRMPNYDLWQMSLRRADQNGIFIATCDKDFLSYGILYLKPGHDPDRPHGYRMSEFHHENPLLLLPGAGRTLASYRGPDVYWYDPHGGMSWGAPYLAGLAALAFQAKPDLSPGEIIPLLKETATATGIGPMVNPAAFISRVKSLNKK